MAETLLIRISTDASKLRSGLSGAQSSLRGFGNKASLLVSAPLALGVGKVVADLGRIAKVEAQTGAVLKSTGAVAGVAAHQIRGQANALEDLTGVESEAIQEGQNLLLTFTNIRNGVGKGNNIFTQATRAMTDMSVALGTDASGSAIQLGKALNDPVKGISALQRVGVSFTAAQRKQIEAMVKSGRVADAQKIILRELRTEFGGSAEAAGKTFAGQLAKAQHAIGAAAESLAVALVPAIKSGAQFVTRLAKSFQNLSPQAKKVILIGVGIVAALGPVVRVASAVITAIRGVAAAMLFLSANPIVLLIGAVVAAGVAMFVFRDKVRDALRWVVDKFLAFVGFFVRGAATAFGWIPGLGPKLKRASERFTAFRDEVNASLGGIKAPKVNIQIAARVKDPFTRQVLLGRVQGPLTREQLEGVRAVAVAVTPGRAMGGPVTAMRPYIVGERGPEMFVPGGSGKIVPNHHLRSGRRAGVAAGRPIVFNIYGGDARTTAREVARILGREADLIQRAG